MAIRFISNRTVTPFEELDGSPEEMDSSTWSGVGATRHLKCLAVDRIQVVKELLGYVEHFGPLIRIYLPASFGPDMPNVVATHAVVKPFAQMTGSTYDGTYADYRYSVIDVTYELGTRIQSGNYGFVALTEEIRDTTEFVTLPVKGLYWGTGGGKEEIDAFDAPGKMNYGLEWIHIISGASVVPPQIFDYVGMINSVAISVPYLGRTFMPYTLLYAEPVVVKEMTFGGMIYRITLRFLHKDNGTPASPKGWNWFPRISASGAEITYEPITDGTDSKNFYRGIDFRDVFV